LLKFSDDRVAAAQDFSAAVEADPTSARALVYRGNLTYHYVERDFAAAEADYARALELEPHFERFYAHTAELYLYTGDADRVIAEAGKGIAREPENHLHSLNLAHGLLFSGDVAGAKQLYLELANEPIEGGAVGAIFAQKDFAHIQKIGAVEYPIIDEIVPWLQRLVRE